jgi:hypothetical protein
LGAVALSSTTELKPTKIRSHRGKGWFFEPIVAAASEVKAEPGPAGTDDGERPKRKRKEKKPLDYPKGGHGTHIVVLLDAAGGVLRTYDTAVAAAQDLGTSLQIVMR